MPEFGTYAEAVVHTLRTRAVQSAILIDDSFPTYQDLLDPDRDGASITETFPDAAAALHLYKTLHEARIVCDVENRIDEIDEAFIEKIRKSDLVVLDWNLRRGSEDSEAAVRVLKGLSASPHFNLVVVYTRANDLTAVWTRAAVRLRGGWQQKERFLDGVDLGEEVDADEVFDEIDPDGRVLEVSDATIRGYVAKGMRGVPDLKALLDKFEPLRVPKQHRHRFAEALIHRAAIRRHDAEVDTPQTIVEGDSSSDDRYLVCGSVFVSFLQKSLGAEQQEERSIFECLDRALISWRPNLLQLLVSELQNELEQNSYAFNEILVPSKELKAGWIFHTLKEYAGGGEAELRNLVASLNERLVESLERSVWASMVDDTSPLLNFGRQAALLSLADLESSKGQDDKTLIAIAMQAAAVEGNDQASRAVMHALNEYLSSDLFRGGHVTTGTVFCTPDKSAWYVCVSPACDMVPRPAKDPDSWQASLHPLQPMNMLRLSKCKPDAALAEAERGVQIFVTVAGERIYLKAVHNITRMPRPMTCLVAGSSTKGGEPWQTHGFAVHLFDKTEAGARIADETLYAVAQLRPAYGARFLHLSGSHQSRVGVDFVRYGTATEEEDE